MQTWMYLAVPICLYACERLIRALRSSVKAVKILKVAVYPGNVLTLQMTKPQGFKYKSGQYMFVNCAAVSPFEWYARAPLHLIIIIISIILPSCCCYLTHVS